MKSRCIRKRNVAVAIVAAVHLAGIVLGASAAGTPSQRGVGVNLHGFVYWMPAAPTVDQMKSAGGWYTQCSYPADVGCTNFSAGATGWDTLEQGQLDLDADGWVRSLPAANDSSVKFRRVSAYLFAEDSQVHAAGKYTVLYEGSGTIAYGLAGRKLTSESIPGRDIVDVTNDTGAGLLLTIQSTDPANYIRNIRVLPPGGVCSLDQRRFSVSAEECSALGLGEFIRFESLPGMTFHPAFVADLRGFRTLRFMDWGMTNSSDLAEWSDRPRPSNAKWSGPSGVPVEQMIALSNEIEADPWVNLPTKGSDAYALEFGRLAKSVIDPRLNLIVEYSNEPWNYGFAQAHWMRDRAATEWPDQIASGVSPTTLQPSWYGMRSAQLCQIIKSAFGVDAGRVKCVLNGQAANSWIGKQQMDCPYAASRLGRPCHQIVDGLAIAPYFGHYISDLSVRSTVSSWYGAPDGGLSKLFEEILGVDSAGQSVSPPLFGKIAASGPKGAVASAAANMVANHTEAAARGLPLLAYEGGQHLTVPGGDTDTQWLNLMIAANRDPRMGVAYSRTLIDWQAAGGQAYALFSHVKRPSKSGAWGLKETQFDTGSAKWQAILPYRDSIACWWPGCSRENAPTPPVLLLR